MSIFSTNGEVDNSTAPSTTLFDSNHTIPTLLIQQRSERRAGRFNDPVVRDLGDCAQSPIEHYRTPLPGYAWGGVDYDNEGPPPSYPNSSLATPIPGSSRTGALAQSNFIERDCVNPPPNYTECTIPPPTYDDLYERPERSPKSKNIRSLLQDIERFVLCLIAVCLGMVLLAIGVKHVVLNTCESRRFLEIWCITTSGIIFICVSVAMLKSLQNCLKKLEDFAPLLIYIGTIFFMSWFVGGLIYSWDQLRDDECDNEVPRTSFAACVVVFVFLVFFCCCGRAAFHQNQTRPNQ